MKKIRILLIEDNQFDAELIQAILIKKIDGIAIKRLDSFALFKEVIRSSNYDLIITDYHLEGFTGIDVINEIRSRDIETPIIVMTGDLDSEIALSVIKLQIDDYVIKEPKYLKQLPSIVSRVLDNSYIEMEMRKSDLPSESNLFDYLDLFGNTSECIQNLRSDGSFINVNSAWHEKFGYTKDELINLKFDDMLVDEWKIEYIQIKINAKLRQDEEHFELQVNSKSGDKIHIEGDANAKINSKGSVEYYWKFHDITESRKIENKILEVREQYMGVFDHAPRPLIMGDHRGIILQINKAACDLLGYSYEEMLGKHIRALTHPLDILKSLKQHKRLFAGKLDKYSIKKRYRHKDGHYLRVKVDAMLVRNDKGQPRFGIAELVKLEDL